MRWFRFLLGWLDASALWERYAIGFLAGWLFGALVLGPLAELRRVWWLLHR